MGLYGFLILASVLVTVASDCSNGQCRLLDGCSKDEDCEAGLHCSNCEPLLEGAKCARSVATNPFKIMNDSLPFNKYAFLTTHNSFAIEGGFKLTFVNQEDSVADQLNNGVRGFMLDTYEFEGSIWLCHAPGGKCDDTTKFRPLIDTLKDFEAFLSANTGEIVTLILEDYVETANALPTVFNDAGLMKYWFPVANMPKNGADWPTVRDMVINNQRLLVFTSKSFKESTEGIAYQWNYMVENMYGFEGMEAGKCSNRSESSPLNDMTKKLVLVNFFGSIPNYCGNNDGELINMLRTCYAAAGNRWANFVAVDFYKKSGGGGAFQATDTLNGKLLCGCDDIHACMCASTSGACTAV